MAPGPSNMLRSRRKDVNVKPNRRLDRKSSRGMLYENEELRMRTITINDEVERGQSDIKKLRRENEQLRREIWGLRDEYDRLEGIIEDLKDETDSEDESTCEDEAPEVDPENLENAEKEQMATHAQPLDLNRGNSFKKEFDGLSIVDEETDDNPTSSNDVTHEATNRDHAQLPSETPIGWQYGNSAYRLTGLPSYPPSPQLQHSQPPCLEGRFFARMPSQVDESLTPLPYPNIALQQCALQYDLNVLNSENAFCGTITLPSGRQGVYYSDSTLPNGGPENYGATLPNWEDNAWGGETVLPNEPRVTVLSDSDNDDLIPRCEPKIGFSYSHYSNNNGTRPSRRKSSTKKPVVDEDVIFDKRCGPDLVMSSVYPVDKVVFQNGGNLDQLLEEVNCKRAQVEIVPEFDEGGVEKTREKQLQVRSSELQRPNSQLPDLRQDDGRQPNEDPNIPEHETFENFVPLSPVVELPENNHWDPAQESSYYRYPESRTIIADDSNPEHRVTVRKRGVLSRQNSIVSSGDDSIVERKQSIIATTISTTVRQDEQQRVDTLTSIYGHQCETYRRPPSFIRLNSIRPHTLVFPTAYADLTVQEVIDALDAQTSTALGVAVRGVRVVNGNCFICLARREDVGSLLEAGFTLRGSPVALHDVSQGSEIVSLSGVPHHVTDSAVAIIMSNFGTIIGEVERRLYKNVDTGERLLRIKPGVATSQQIPPTISVAGAQVAINLLPPHEVAKLGFVGARENRANEGTGYEDNYSFQPARQRDNPSEPSTSPENSFNSDRYKTQLHVRLKTPDLDMSRPITDKRGPPPNKPNKPTPSRKHSTALNPPLPATLNNTHPQHPSLPNGSCNPFTQNYQQIPQPHVQYPNIHPQPQYNPNLHGPMQNPQVHHTIQNSNQNPSLQNPNLQGHMQNPNAYPPSQIPNVQPVSQNPNINPLTQNPNLIPPTQNPNLHQTTQNMNQQGIAPNNPFIPGFTQMVNDHVNPTFNTYTPRNSPILDRKFSGTNNSFVEPHPNLAAAISPKLGRKQSCPVPNVGSSAPVTNLNQGPNSSLPYPPNPSYLYGTSQSNSSIQNIEQNQSNALKSNQNSENHLEIPTLPVSSVPNSPQSTRRQRVTRKISAITRQRSSEEIVHNQLSTSAPTSRHVTAPNSPNINRANNRGVRKMSSQSISSQNIDNSLNENEKSLPNATSSPVTKQKHGNRKLSVSINENQHQGTNIVDVSRSSSSGQDSPTKVDRRRRVSIYFNNKKSSRRNSAVSPNGLTRSASLDPTRCRFGNQSLDGGAEQTTTNSERERTNSVSSRGSSVGGSGKRKSRRSSFRALDGSENGKVPWCACWGNGCL